MLKEAKLQEREARGTKFDHVLFTKPNVDGVCKVAKVKQYKYLGVVIDSKLMLKQWTNKIAQEVRSRTEMIRRILKSMQISRRNAEQLYSAYVRGYLNYGMHIWSTKKGVVNIIAADNFGLRTVSGLLLRTPLESIYQESSLMRLQMVITNTQLTYVAKVYEREHVEMIRTFNRGRRRRNGTIPELMKV